MNTPNVDYLNMLQGNIARMSNYSSAVKNWSITTTVALLTLRITISGLQSSTERELQLLLISMVAVAMFWWLDAFFFYTEKKYRVIYNAAIKNDWISQNNFNLTPDLAIDLTCSNSTNYCKIVSKLWLRVKAICSTAVFPVHSLLLAFICLFHLNILS